MSNLGKRAFTLIEVVISSAILAVLVLATASVFIPLQRANQQVGRDLDNQTSARRILDIIRRDLRQSGWEAENDTDQCTVTATSGTPPTNAVQFKQRTKFDSSASTPEDDNWSGIIRYEAQADGTFTGVPGAINRFTLRRREDTDGDGNFDITITIGRNLSQVVFERLDDHTVEIELEVLRPDPNWSGGTAPTPIRTRFVERITLLNRKSS